MRVKNVQALLQRNTGLIVDVLIRIVIALIFPFALVGHTHAANPPERFALLVGVDNYAQPGLEAARVTPLKGPRNDVELMRRLLIDKYGFTEPEKQISVLLGKDATRAAIERSFRSHLIENTQKHPGATILFYFSGHGSQTANKSGTEGDEVDETLVAYDSRAAGGSDIRDKEIANWLKALRKHTKNITVILDSCHSGDATKDVGKTPIVAKGLPPNPNTDSKGVTPRALSARIPAGSRFLPSQEYSVIAGSSPNEFSNEGMVLNENGQRQYQGFLTHFLVRTLRLNPSQTYHQLVTSIQQDVRRVAPSQTPQAEGNVLIPFLGDASDSESPFIPIVKIASGKQITIGAGNILGVGPGTLMSIYSGSTRRLVGEKGKLGNARVVKAELNTAELELIDSPARAIEKTDKVVIISPYPGTSRINLVVDELPGQNTTPQDKKLLSLLRGMVKENNLIRIAAPSEEWSIAIQRGCISGERFIPSSKLSFAPPNCTAVYYATPRDNRDRALASLHVPTSDLTDSAEKLADYVTLRARQDSLRLFSNSLSPLNDKVKLAVVKRNTSNGNLVEAKYNGHPPVKIRNQETFQIELTNSSDKELYVATLVLGTSGKVFLFTPSSNGELVLPGKAIRVNPEFRAGLPTGLETYKVIATTRKDVNFRILESDGSKEAAGSSAFGIWMKNWSNVSSRDPIPVPALNIDEWVTQSIDIEVIE